MHDNSPPHRRVLFFRQGSFSHINERVGGWLREQFPREEIVEIDILQDVVKSSRRVVIRGGVTALATYLRRIAAGEDDFHDLFYHTPYLFHAIRRMVAEKYGRLAESALFSIQTQSLYDASIDGLPHFLYTDHTHLANLRYPGARTTDMASRRWIELETALYHRVRMNLVMSGFVRDSLVEDYGCEASRVALIGAAPNLAAPAGVPANSGYSNRTVLFTGIDWQRKGGPVLLEAFRRVLKELPNARLIIAGAAPAIDLPNVQVMGRVPLTEVSRLLSSACVLALPSLREPQGIIAIEALMHGIPVIASNVGALAETVDDGVSGRVIAPGDAGGLAAAMIELLSNPVLCRRYGEAGREIAMRRFSPGAVSLRMGDAIRAGIAGGARTVGLRPSAP